MFHVYKVPPLIAVMSQINPLNIYEHEFPNIRLNIPLPCMDMCFKLSLFLQDNSSMYIYSSSRVCYILLTSYPPHFYHLTLQSQVHIIINLLAMYATCCPVVVQSSNSSPASRTPADNFKFTSLYRRNTINSKQTPVCTLARLCVTEWGEGFDAWDVLSFQFLKQLIDFQETLYEYYAVEYNLGSEFCICYPATVKCRM